MRSILAAVIVFTIALVAPAFAMADGSQTFTANCAACHAGGGNLVNPGRTLAKSDLESYLANYGSGHEDAIIAQVTSGKEAMPSFAGTLTSAEIADVAAYVESMASKGWG